MKATESGLLSFLNNSPQFVIPIYQRTYSWTEKECRQLWDDILRAGREDGHSIHFIGSVVGIDQRDSTNSDRSPYLVIDGQQRLTTVTLLLAALAEALEKQKGETVELSEGFSARKVRNRYLIDPDEDDERRFQLLLSETDRETLKAIVARDPLPENPSLRINEGFKFFQSQIGKLTKLEALCRGLDRLFIVDISLNRGQDNPQLIFESMNSTGKELSQADLIRNFVLMGLQTNLQSRLYKNYWRPMERAFGQDGYSARFDAFMRHYLTVKTGEIPRLSEVYDSFKWYARAFLNAASETAEKKAREDNPEISEQNLSKVEAAASTAAVETLVSELRAFAGYYCAMALGAEPDADLNFAFHDLRELKVDVAYPFLLELYADYATKQLPKADFLEAIRLVEAYVFRRAICMIPTNSLNKTFATFTKSLKKDRYLESIKAHFLLLPSYRRFPGDGEFQRELQKRDLYNFRSRSYWLRRFENHGRKERVPVDEYTIEHIMPQNEDMRIEWKTALGDDWQRIHQEYLHTLGNLTLTGYNSEYSDLPFVDKRDMVGGFKNSPVRLNDGLGTVEQWNEEAIRSRAQKLAAKAPGVWPGPSLAEDILSIYRAPKEASASYSIADHPYLNSGLVRELFEAFRKDVLALDPCVSEEFLKLYVAYKAETNFVDVVPQAKALRLSLNMKFTDINDPRGICKDTSQIGRWGNGEVEVKISALDEIPYTLGLVRQSLEQQLGNGGDG
ncbi:GmrSD restriction endonuclease domain-containing protein [Roseibium alexandrii]|uniref:DUF262 domain-containing protein n=1 Tax=Roseibium alexandrii (strain DSM 17067 / NCIMB 14079 / DFL-11) TaxID=244592 RepID=A0A5E8H0W2_ROSAD|nr:DUF262 domain-containing protein [Roseibium alexandrii]EEE46137.2 hypothetical protein SADFL11_3426 [Roseibium alexandrii DFL-11]